MPKIDIASAQVEVSTGYPEPFRSVVAGRSRQRLGNAASLDQFGVNLTRLKPGAQSAQRHWHAAEDELVFVLEGTLVLCEDAGETVLKAGVTNGHCLINRSGADAVYLEIGTRAHRDEAAYPDIDLHVRKDENGLRYTHKSGEPYPR
jgi:uncharacterized cupin superfamily protein